MRHRSAVDAIATCLIRLAFGCGLLLGVLPARAATELPTGSAAQELPPPIHIVVDREGTAPFLALGELIGVLERLGRGGLRDQQLTLGELLEALLKRDQADPHWRQLIGPDLLRRTVDIAVRQDASGALSAHLSAADADAGRVDSPVVPRFPIAADDAAAVAMNWSTDALSALASATSSVAATADSAVAPAATERGSHVILVTGRDDGTARVGQAPPIEVAPGAPSLFGPADVPPGPERRLVRRIIALLPRLEASGAVFHTFSLGAVPGLLDLRRLALGTGGMNAQVYGGDDFLRLLVSIIADDYEPFGAPVPTPSGWNVDPDVSEMTLWWNDTGPARLVTPAGQVLTRAVLVPSVHWQVADGVQVVTVLEPATGTWRLDVPEPTRARPRALGPLYLRTAALPARSPPGQQQVVPVDLYAGGEPVVDARLLARVRLIAHLEEPLGAVRHLRVERGAAGTGNAHWRVLLDGIDLLGDHWLYLQALGPSFVAAQHHPLVSAPVVDIFTTHVWKAGDVWGRLILTDTGRALSPADVRIEAMVETPRGDRRRLIGVANPEIESEWWLELPPVPGSLGYLVDLRVTGRWADGTPLEFRPPVFEVAWPFPTPELIPPELVSEVAPEPGSSPAGAAAAPGGPLIVDVDAAIAGQAPPIHWIFWFALAVFAGALVASLLAIFRPGPVWIAAYAFEDELALARSRLQVALGIDAADVDALGLDAAVEQATGAS